MVKILIVDDDENIRKLISKFLTGKGYETECACNGAEALVLMGEGNYDMLVADIMMPKVDGFELVDDVRSIDSKIPILMITARDSFDDKKKGFLYGTDDYMTKPIDLDEMGLRIAALLRRAKISSEQKIVVGNVSIDEELRLVITPRGTVELPRREFDLLYKLMSYPKKIFTRRQLMDSIWGMDSDADERTVDVHIKRLREKFEDVDEFEIVTVRGLGYKAEHRI